MFKKLILLFVVLFLFKFNYVLASSVRINEFVSDPESGPEWIELLNTSSSLIDLSGWTWTELASPGGNTEHENSPKNLSGTITPGGVFIFEMNSALNNTGDSIALYQGGSLEDRVTFGKVSNYPKDLDAPTKGKSGAFIGGEWQTNQVPTKSSLNPISSSPAETNNNESLNSEISVSDKVTTVSKTPIATQKMKAEITTRPVAFVGVSFPLEGRIFGTSGEPIFTGKYYWNFGDGNFRETKVINVDKFNHTYFYPGDYTILLNHYPDFFSEVPDATESFKIKVVKPEIYISSVGQEKDFYVEIANNTDYDADLSKWFLLGNQKSFLIPVGTTLAAGNKMVISSTTTHFSVEDKNNLRLMTPQGDVAFDYSSSTVPSKKIFQNNVLSYENYVKGDELSTIKNSFNSSSANNSASVIKSNVLGGQKEGGLTSIVPIISFIFIGTSASAVYFIRRKKQNKEPGSDFEILDE